MTDREQFGLLCNKVFMRFYEREGDYQKEDGTFSSAHERNMMAIVGGHSVGARTKVRFVWLLAAVLLALAILGGAILAFYHPLTDTIVLNGLAWSRETPSRVLFFHSDEGRWMGDDYVSGSANGLCYYSKADGNLYVYCNDPLCDHTSCPERFFTIEESFLIGDRIYTFFEEDENFGVCSFGADSLEVRVDWTSEEHPEMGAFRPEGLSHQEFAYDNYLYAWMRTEDGERHTLRFDAESGKMEDLTAKTGNDFSPAFAYGGMLYGYSAEYGRYVKADLSLSEIIPAEDHVQEAFARENEKGESTRFLHQIAVGHRMYGTLITEKENGERESTIQVLDMKAGTVTQISNETFGRDAKCVIYADGKYLYYLAEEPIYVGQNAKYDLEVYNEHGGKLYRAKLDGSDSECIFEDPAMNFYAGYHAYVCGDDFLIYASRITERDGDAMVYASGVYIGHFDQDGKLAGLAYAEVVA